MLQVGTSADDPYAQATRVRSSTGGVKLGPGAAAQAAVLNAAALEGPAPIRCELCQAGLWHRHLLIAFMPLISTQQHYGCWPMNPGTKYCRRCRQISGTRPLSGSTRRGPRTKRRWRGTRLAGSGKPGWRILQPLQTHWYKLACRALLIAARSCIRHHMPILCPLLTNCRCSKLRRG